MTQLLRISVFSCAVALLLSSYPSEANASGPITPGAAARSSASNFKDMVLAVCIARSQQGQAAADAAGSVQALREWTQYDVEASPDEIDRTVNRFLSRNYRNPLGDQDGAAAEFNLLKCLDLYHSRDLEALSKRLVLPTSRGRDKR